jgi:hypothetical protein
LAAALELEITFRDRAALLLLLVVAPVSLLFGKGIKNRWASRQALFDF